MEWVLDMIKASSSVRLNEETKNWEYLQRCKKCGNWVHLVEIEGIAGGKCDACGTERIMGVTVDPTA